MKKIFSITGLLLLSTLLFISSCKKDDDDNPGPTGSLAGNWDLNENSNDFGPSTYNVVITDTASNIQFAYLYGFTKKTFALVNGNSINIPVQTIQGSNVSGLGIVSGSNRIDLTYYVQSTALHYDTIVAVLTKM